MRRARPRGARPGSVRASWLLGSRVRLGADLEDRIARRDLEQLGGGRVGVHAVEEDPDFKLPPLQVGPKDLRLLVVRKLGCGEALDPPTNLQLTAAGHSQVAYPLGLAARGNKEPATVVGQNVHRVRPPLAGGPAPHVQYATPPDTDPELGQSGNR